MTLINKFDAQSIETISRIIGNIMTGSTRITLTTKVTGKGQVYFINKFLS